MAFQSPDVETQMKAYTGREEPIKIMTLVHDGIVTINIIASAIDRENAKNILDKAEQDIRKILDHAVFGVGDETLECAVAVLLKKYHKTIAVAESCTGDWFQTILQTFQVYRSFFRRCRCL